MLVGKLTEHLKYLISNSRNLTNGERRRDRSYHSILEGKPALTELTSQVIAFLPTKEGCASPSHQFSLQLLKRIILTQFELLCVSVELQSDVEYAFSECCSLCEHISHCNDKFASISLHSKCLEFAHFSDVAISTQMQVIVSIFLHEPSIEGIISVAKFEHGFISALAAIFATFTTLLQPSVGSQKLKTVFVSEEMFSIVHTSNLSWLDCLIPGVQSEVLRLIVEELIARLWSGVASYLVAHLQPLTAGGEHADALLILLRRTLHHQELNHHVAVKQCLWYTISAIEHQQSLSTWDKGFQSLLIVSPRDTRRNFRPAKTAEAHATQSVDLFLTRVLPPLETCHTNKPHSNPPLHTKCKTIPSLESISYHIDDLRLSIPRTAALQRSIEHITRYLSQGFKKSLASVNMRSAGQLLMVDGPQILSALSRTVLQVAQTSCPHYGFPLWSRLHSTENCSRAAYATAYNNHTQLKESVETMSVSFHNIWQEKCGQVLQASFPRVKFWRSTNKRGDGHKFEPGSYCNEVIEELLLPVMEAVRGLTAESAQLSFLTLTVSVFLSELRRVITTNKRTYSSSSGRQLLTDFHHIRHWLTSPDQGLSQQALELISSLPALLEIDRGLLEVCGTADQVDSQPTLEFGEAWHTLTCARQLTVCRKQAWISDKDWTECTL